MLKTPEEQKALEKDGVGVIVGRFQVADLTPGHIDLFNSVIARHQKTIIVVGLAPIKATANNPLDYEARRKMILEVFPNVTVAYIKDTKYDENWSKNLDAVINDNIPIGANVILYGSRDSFISYYSGKFKTKELIQETYVSGTKERKEISYISGASSEFRKGVIWATNNRYPTCYPCVDIGILQKREDKIFILLGKKEGEKFYRFPGGFVEKDVNIKNNYLEVNARRECQEETGILLETLQYVDSFLINDWRYRGEKDCIVTSLFYGWMTFGRPEPNDDIAEVKWFEISDNLNNEKIMDDFCKKNLMDEHQKLFKSLIEKIFVKEVNGTSSLINNQ